jgi:predicted ATPase
MICPNCGHKEDYDFYICPQCQYDIDVDVNGVDPDFDDELASVLDEQTSYQIDANELMFEEDTNIRYDNNVIEELVDTLIEENKNQLDTNQIFDLNIKESGIIGRDDELRKLLNYYQQIRESNTVSSLTLVSESGLGKTDLTSLFLRKLKTADKSIMIVESMGEVNSQNEDYSIFKSILKKLTQISEADLIDIKKQKLKMFLKEATPFHLYHELKVVFSRLLDMKTEKDIEEMDIMSYDRLLKRSFRQIFNHYTSQNIFIILAIKDFHNIDIRSIEMIDYFMSLPNYRNLLFLLTSELEDKIQRFLKGEQSKRFFIKLLPLTQEDSINLVRYLLKDINNLDSETIELIVGNTKGTPLHIKESINYLVNSDAIIFKDGKYTGVNKLVLKRTQIPMTFEETIRAKIDRLSKFDYSILQLASISGEIFKTSHIKLLLNIDIMVIREENKIKLWSSKNIDKKLEESFENLINEKVIKRQNNISSDQEYLFSNITEQKLMYSTIAPRLKKIYHNYLAQYLESKLDKKMERNLEQLSLQYKLASNTYQASKYYFIAAKKAEERYANKRAIKYNLEALNLLSEENVLNRLEVLHNLGSLYTLIGKTEDAISTFEKMVSLSQIIINNNKLGAAYNKIGRIYRDIGSHKKSSQYLNLAYDSFRIAKDRRGIASTLDDMGRLFWQQGKFEESLKNYMKSLDIRKKLNMPKSIALSLNNIGLLYYSQGFVDEAEEYLFEAYKLRKEIKDKQGEMSSLNNLATLTYNKGDDIEAKALWLKSLTIAEEVGDIKYQSTCMNNLGELFIESSKYSKANDYLKNALEIALESSNKRILGYIYLNLGELNLKQSKIANAKKYLERAIELSEESGDKQVTGRVYCLLGNIESATLFNDSGEDGVAPAEDYYLRSLDLLRKISEPLMAATNISYAEYLLSKGKRGKAKKLLNQAESIYQNYNMQLKLSKIRRLKKDIL